MKTVFVIIVLGIAINNLEAQPFKLDTLLFNGNANNRINYVILGDGYLNTQLEKFLGDAENVVASLFNNSPFKEYMNYFNVFAISVASNEEGAASGPSNLIDNYYGSTFNFAEIQRLLVPTREDRVFEVLATTFPAYDQIMMIVNSTEYGGSGGEISTSSVHQQASEIAIHELGHSFAGLSDEYWAGEQYAGETPNMTQQFSPGLVKWKNWLNDSGIGIIAHSTNRPWYKPHNNCKMQFLNEQFCAVCRERFVSRIQELISPVDDYSADIGSDVISFNLDLVKPNPNTLNIKWTLNESEFDKNTEGTNISVSDLNTGVNTVEAIIYDSTIFDRQNTVYITSVKWTIESNITAWIQKTTVNRPNTIVTATEREIQRIRISVFPNPSRNKLTIEWDAINPTPIELTIIDSEGKRLYHSAEKKQGQVKFSREIDISTFSSGLYILDFRSGSFQQSFRIIKSD